MRQPLGSDTLLMATLLLSPADVQPKHPRVRVTLPPFLRHKWPPIPRDGKPTRDELMRRLPTILLLVSIPAAQLCVVQRDYSLENVVLSSFLLQKSSVGCHFG